MIDPTASVVSLLSERQFELLGRMELWKRSDLLDRISGFGRIRQDDSGNLRYEFQTNRDLLSPDWFASRNSNAGLVVADEDHCDLSITDWTGQTWRSDRVYPSTGKRQGSGCLVSGELRSVRCEARAGQGRPNMLRLYFIGKYEFPANKWVKVTGVVDEDRVISQGGDAFAEFQAAGCTVRISSEGGWLEVIVTRDADELHLGAIHRVAEALQFVLGQPLPLAAYELWEGPTRRFALFGGRPAPLRRASAAPIQLPSGEHEDRTWRLFDAYLAYTIQDETSMVHPLFQCSSTLLKTDERYFEDRVLSMSRAVEGLVKMIANRVAEHEITDEELRRAEAAVQGLGLCGRSQERLLGSLRAAKRPSVSGVLRELRSRGCLTHEEFRAWQRLRHSITHGDEVAFDQEAVTDRHRLEVLINKLVFLVIRYRGPYTDYGELGFPTRRYEHSLGVTRSTEFPTGA